MSRPIPPGRRLHRRTYDIDSYLEDDDHIRIVGVLRDLKPDGLWAFGDTEPLTIHHMKVELLIEIATLTIVDVSTEMMEHPQRECPNILPAYRELVGLSIARGFTHKVRDLYGGPKACTHILALLNAMAPVAIQSLFGLFNGPPAASASGANASPSNEERAAGFALNRNSCHVWADEGPMFARVARGEPVPMPLTMAARRRALGIDT